MTFDMRWLENFDEKIIIETIGSKIAPLVVNPGKIVLTTLNLYFQPFNDIEPVRNKKCRITDTQHRSASHVAINASLL